MKLEYHLVFLGKDNKHSHKMIEIMEDLEEQLEVERSAKLLEQTSNAQKIAFK